MLQSFARTILVAAALLIVPLTAAAQDDMMAPPSMEMPGCTIIMGGAPALGTRSLMAAQMAAPGGGLGWDAQLCYKQCREADKLPGDCWSCCYGRNGICAPDNHEVVIR